MFETVEKLNSNFYPVPLDPPQVLPNGVKNFQQIADGFLTKDDFVVLYDKPSEILHARNPFSTKVPVIQIGYSVAQWVSRIQKLLGLHSIDLVDGTKWIVEIPSEGPVRLHAASPVANGTELGNVGRAGREVKERS